MSDSPVGPELPGMHCVKHIKSGGFSDVFLYEQHQPRMKVAVKLLTSEELDEAQRRQFAEEADTMAELAEHPYIVPVLNAGTAPDGRPYLVMRYFPQPDLAQRIAQQTLSVEDTLKWGVQLASAVESAHRAGIIHRDIKPANVLVSSYSVPALADFGIAGRGERAEGEDVGVSLPWSPPEVLSGRSQGSAASDVYSLAATLWNALVGRSPFAVPGDNSRHAMFGRILNANVPPTGRLDVPASLDRLLQQAMSKDPARRPTSAMELARHLRRVEQELGFQQTDIIVTESDPSIGQGSTGPTGALSDLEELEPGVTVMSPKRVAKPVPDPSADETQRRGVARVVKSTVEADPTARRPARPDPSAARHVAIAVDDEAPSVAASRLAVAAVVLVLLVAVVAGGVLLTRGGDDAGPSTVPTSSGPTSIDDVVPGVEQVSTPEIVGRVSSDGRSVTFSAAAEQDDDRFQWQTRSGDGDYVPVDAPPAQRSISVKVTPGQECAQLIVRRTDSVSDPGEQCVTVP